MDLTYEENHRNGARGFAEMSADVLQPWPCSDHSCVDCEEQFHSIADQHPLCTQYV